MKRLAIYLHERELRAPGDILITKAGRVFRVLETTVRKLGLQRERQRLVCEELVPHLVTIRRATRVRR